MNRAGPGRTGPEPRLYSGSGCGAACVRQLRGSPSLLFGRSACVRPCCRAYTFARLGVNGPGSSGDGGEGGGVKWREVVRLELEVHPAAPLVSHADQLIRDGWCPG